MEASSYSDKQLLDGLKKDSIDAFDKLYFRYWKQSFQIANKILHNASVSEDVVQEVFADLWLKRNNAFIYNFKSYIFQSTRFQVFKIIRHNKVIAASVERDFIMNFATNDGIHNLALNDIKQILDETVASLPTKCREIFTLSRHKHMTSKEIARYLNISPKTVDNQINIALKKIRASFSSSFVLIEILISLYDKH
ncbi:RNA polymerase sigma-70 factor [Pedobacter terrae]|uniref:RNA polymerase sigma-70 factor n=1 Tax=Pedobacter terrae TaxID=405671 RepID=UPI002FFA1EE4